MGFFEKLKNVFKKKDPKYELGLHKSSQNFKTLKILLENSKKIDDELFEQLEDIFISSDVGIDTVIYFIDQIKETVKNKNITNPIDLQQIIIDKLFELYLKDDIIDVSLDYKENETNIYLFVGVNGTGKTTTIGKLAYQFKNQGKKVLLIAADTFRAAAIDQLKVWSERAGVDFFAKKEFSDPSNVCFEGLDLAFEKKYDVVLIDTAGRLQNKVNLMNELAKIKRVIASKKENTLRETLLVIDATTGQNGLKQAEIFKEVTDVSGIILTKLDGTAKGGIVLAIRHNLGLTIKYCGLGEKITDLVPFDFEQFITGMFKDFFDKDEN